MIRAEVKSQSYAENILDKAQFIYQAYCDFTDDDIAKLPDMNQTEVLTLLTRMIYG